MKKCDSLFALFLFNIKHNWVYIDTLVCIDSIQLSDSTYWKKGKKKNTVFNNNMNGRKTQ